MGTGKTDIRNRQDVEELVNRFYEKVRSDDTIGFIFTEVAKVDFEKHLPIMYDFWEGVLFFTGNYAGNPLIAHRRLNNIIRLESDHFKRWISLFHSTVDELFCGEKAELAKQRSSSIATVMQLKMKT